MKKSNQDPRKGRKLYQWRRIVINQPTSGPPCQGPLLQRSCPVAGPLIETDLALWGPLRETNLALWWASERDRRPIPTVSVWGQSQTAVVLLWSLSFYWEVSNILPEVRKGNLILLIMCFSRTAMDLEKCGECCTTRCSVSDHSSEPSYCPTVTQDVNLWMLASR